MAAGEERVSKPEYAYRWIRSEIFSGRLTPRDRVNADGISRQLGISKIPVREAIQRLTSEGMLVQQPYAGAIVAPLSWRELKGIRQARGALEPIAAAQGTSLATSADIADLKAILKTMSTRVKTADVTDFFDLNRAFHLKLVELSGYPIMVELLDLVLHKVSRYRAVLPIPVDEARSVLAEHKSIVEAVEARDAQMVAELVSRHVTGEHTIVSDARRLDEAFFEDQP